MSNIGSSIALFKAYPYVSSDGRDDGAADGPRIFRGGAYVDVALSVRAAFCAFQRPTRWPAFFHSARLAFSN
jgi:hypothetical protein